LNPQPSEYEAGVLTITHQYLGTLYGNVSVCTGSHIAVIVSIAG